LLPAVNPVHDQDKQFCPLLSTCVHPCTSVFIRVSPVPFCSSLPASRFLLFPTCRNPIFILINIKNYGKFRYSNPPVNLNMGNPQ
jgi:hypothetical protein